MADKDFADALNKQIANELAAAQQYIAAAVYYDSETLPQLAGFFYRQALEERNHAMMMVQFLIDTDQKPVIPAVDAPKMDFADIVAPVSMALEQEKTVGEEINDLFKLARDTSYFQGEQFLQWSPHLHAQNIKTPTLIITNELDFRVPVDQGLQMFTVLRRNGVPAEALIFPDEGHWVLQANNSRVWHDAVFGWMKKYLQ